MGPYLQSKHPKVCTKSLPDLLLDDLRAYGKTLHTVLRPVTETPRVSTIRIAFYFCNIACSTVTCFRPCLLTLRPRNLKTVSPVRPTVHTNPSRKRRNLKTSALFFRLGLPSTLIRHENGDFRKRSLNWRNLKTSALRLS